MTTPVNPFDAAFSQEENPFDAISGRAQNTMDRLRERVDEAMRSSVGPTGTKVLANPLVRSITEAPLRAASVVEDLVTHPIKSMEAASTGVGEGIKGLAGLAGTVGSQIGSGEFVEASKSIWDIVYEGMFRPLLAEPIEAGVGKSLRPSQFGKELSDEEASKAGKDAVANWAGVFIGATVGRSFTRAGVAANRITELADAKSMKDVFAKLGTLDAPAQMEIASALSDINLPARFRRGVLEGVTGGASTGLMLGDTQEERFQAAFNYGLAGALLGGAFESAFGGVKHSSELATTARALASDTQAKAIMQLPPKNAAKAAAELLSGIPIDEVVWRNLPSNEVVILRNLDEVSPSIQALAARERTPDNIASMSEHQTAAASGAILNQRANKAVVDLWNGYTPKERTALVERLIQSNRLRSDPSVSITDRIAKIDKAFKEGKNNAAMDAIIVGQQIRSSLDLDAIRATITQEDRLNYFRVQDPEAFAGPRLGAPVIIHKNPAGKFDVLFDPINVAESDVTIDPVILAKYERLREDGYSDYAAKIPTNLAIRLAQKLVGNKTYAELIAARLGLEAGASSKGLSDITSVWYIEDTARQIVDAGITDIPLPDYRTLASVAVEMPRSAPSELSKLVTQESIDAVHSYLYGKGWKDSIREHWDALRSSPHPEDRALLTLIMDRLGITDMGEVGANLMTPGEGMPDSILGALANALADLRDTGSIENVTGQKLSAIENRILKLVARDPKGEELARANILNINKPGSNVKIKFADTVTDAQALDLEYLFNGIGEQVRQAREIASEDSPEGIRVAGKKFLKTSSEMLQVPRLRALVGGIEAATNNAHLELFSRKGFIPGQVVMYRGRSYYVSHVSEQAIKIAKGTIANIKDGSYDTVKILKEKLSAYTEEVKTITDPNSPRLAYLSESIDELNSAIAEEVAAQKKMTQIIKADKDGYILLHDVLTNETTPVRIKDIQRPPKLARIHAFLSAEGNEMVEVVDIFGDIKETHTLNLLNLKDTTASPTYPLFTDAEKAVIDANFTTQRTKHADVVNELGRRFTANDLLVQPQDGRMIVRSRVTGKVLGVVDTIDDLADIAPDLTGAFNAGKGGGGTKLPPPNRMFFGESPAGSAPRGSWASKLDVLRITSYWVQPTQYFFKAIENLFPNAKVYTEFFRPIQEGLYKFNAARAPWIKVVSEISSKLLKGVDPVRRTLLFDYLEAMTPDEVKAGRLPRPMNAEEVGAAESFAEIFKSNANADLSVKRVMRVRDMRARVRDIEGISPKHRQKLLDDFVASLDGGELSPNEIAFDELLSARRHTPTFSHYAITDLMSAILTDRKGRADFAKIHGLTGAELGAAAAIENVYKSLANVFGIKDAKRINGYISHIRKYSDLGEVRVKELYPELNKIEQEFFANLPRVGNIVELNKDPIDVLLRYINAGFRSQHLSTGMMDARIAANEAASVIANTKHKHARLAGEALKRHTEAFLKEVNESSTDVEALTHAAYMEYMKSHGIGQDAANGTLSAFLSAYNPLSSNALLKNIEFAAQGFRPIAGIRDLVAFTQIFTMRFGVDYLADGAKNFSTIWKSRKLLQELGETPGLAMTFAESSTEQATREALDAVMGNVQMLPAAFDALREAGFKASLQPTVYELAHAFTYSIVKGRALESMGKFMKKHIGRSELENQIHLDTYSPATIQKFNELLEAGKIEQAATFLAKDAGYEIVGHFGKANSPRLMWNQWGRVLGQFGQWPAWFLNVSADLLTRGKGKTRAKNAAYIAASVGAFAAAQSATGFNLQSWSMDPRNSLQYKGSPTWNMITALVDLAASDYEPERNFASTTLESLFSPSSGIMIPIPLTFRSSLVETIGRIDQEDPAWVIGWKLLGGSVDKEIYPKPLSMEEPNAKPTFGSDENEGLPLAAIIPNISSDEFEAARADATKPKISKSTLAELDPAKLMLYGALLGVLRKAPVRLGIEIEVIPKMAAKDISAIEAQQALGKSASGLISMAKWNNQQLALDKLGPLTRNSTTSTIYGIEATSNLFKIGTDAGDNIELRYGIFTPEYFDIERLKIILAALEEHTDLISHPVTGHKTFDKKSMMRIVSNMHIHVSPVPRVLDLPSRAKAYHYASEAQRAARATDPAAQQYYASQMPMLNSVINLQKAASPFEAPPQFTSLAGATIINPYKESIEFRNMMGTFDINTIISNLNKAIMRVMNLTDKFGEMLSTDFLQMREQDRVNTWPTDVPSVEKTLQAIKEIQAKEALE